MYTSVHSGTISKNHNNKQVLDKLQVERERGITVKAQVCVYKASFDVFLMVLHVLCFEVSMGVS